MFVQQDWLVGNTGVGPVGEAMNDCRWDPALRRPYLVSRGGRNIPCVTLQTGVTFNNDTRLYEPKYTVVPVEALQKRGVNSPVFNATTLRKEEWDMLDQVVLRAARFRLRAWADLAAANSFGGFNGMSKMILEHETMSDPGEAVVDMDGLTPGRTDSPQFQLQGLPLPITHADFWFSSRRLAISRNSGTPLDTTMGESAGRRVAEMIEKTLLGVETGIIYGGNSTQVGGYGRTSQVYGYTNFPSRLTKTNAYKPTGNGRSGTGWVPLDTLKDVLAARDQLYLNKFYGPYMVYHSNDWDQYMDSDYILTGGNVATQTLRDRIRSIDGVVDVRRLDFLFATAPTTPPGGVAGAPGFSAGENLFPFVILIVQMTPDVCRAVNGMDITTVQWETLGGMQLNFKVMAIQVPQLRADFYGNCGILHMTANN
jgi:hypothetical protein